MWAVETIINNGCTGGVGSSSFAGGGGGGGGGGPPTSSSNQGQDLSMHQTL